MKEEDDMNGAGYEGFYHVIAAFTHLQTPSPHRFLSSSSNSKPLQPKPPPTLRSRPHLKTSHQPQQFAFAPRFSFASRNLKADGNHDENHHTSSPGQQPSSSAIPPPRPRLPVHAREEIEEGNSDEGHDGVKEATEDDGLRAEDRNHKNSSFSALYSSTSPACKRRRRCFKPVETMDPDTVILSSPTPSSSSHERIETLHTENQDDHNNLSSPPAFVAPSTTTASSTMHPRFRSIHSFPTPSHSLPKFLLPNPASPPPLALPHALSSPQRRNAKFVPGGLAASLRDLVIEMAVQRQEQQLPVRGSHNPSGTGWEFRVQVRKVRSRRAIGAGMVLVRGQIDDADEEREEGEGKGWVLLGPGTRAGIVVGEGDVVGVKRPVWKMEVAGELWTVGVEWAVLR
ncbi:hypothetical protein MMC07_005117 [Pseudocyphellaria aurata]|nr:hypothetical protein [Pseudocyphellaria aurata]